MEVYITNAVKRRPPENRDPTLAELRWYAPWLMEEIRLVDPLIILCVGRLAMKAILDESQGITKIRGKWVERDLAGKSRLCMPIFHPAYLLRNASREPGSPKSLTWMDMQAVRAKYLELTEPWEESDCPCSDFGGDS